MDRDTDLFVQAFWVKCREVIRPEIDSTIGELRADGHEPQVSTQEFSAKADDLPAARGPSVILSCRPAGAADGDSHPWLEFHADIARQAIDVVASDKRKHSYEIADLGPAEVKRELDNWRGRLVSG